MPSPGVRTSKNKSCAGVGCGVSPLCWQEMVCSRSECDNVLILGSLGEGVVMVPKGRPVVHASATSMCQTRIRLCDQMSVVAV